MQTGEGNLNRDDLLGIILGEQTKRLNVEAKPIESVLQDKKEESFTEAIAAVEDEDDRYNRFYCVLFLFLFLFLCVIFF
jgi:hypothetical protein